LDLVSSNSEADIPFRRFNERAGFFKKSGFYIQEYLFLDLLRFLYEQPQYQLNDLAGKDEENDRDQADAPLL